MSETPVLQIRSLKTYFYTKNGVVKAVDGVDLDVGKGRITALVGGSGSGKSMLSMSVMNLVEKPGRIIDGQVWLNGRDLRTLSEKELKDVRGKEIAMIFQEPTSAMNPVLKVKNHLFEAVHTHDKKLRMRDKLDEFRDVLLRVGLGNPDKILESYPFELSGGMCQRVMVAMGIVTNASVLIADEPTSSLDLTTQAAILEELLRLKDAGMAIVLITHDLGVVAQTADDMYVIKDGKVIESGPVCDVFASPQQAYTKFLMEPIALLR
ncbi:peptide/nickel transport system ATP-binding protein [Sporobacter termitidis DSM 10068]|uniref:Peptide/nickel transport system ATP-binding protein n=1 Tax=Sporobacter termitidis DSM 10068 TaxID=1123282 RepID=A0A1M5WJC4_9FIRM|nr:ABC transporter ATP-binding protein [Sporobacter termitidis]SHH87527.1 peptide/nickel transport system ATP-binding protein [Sporobacter termitidis DSM 10068]